MLFLRLPQKIMSAFEAIEPRTRAQYEVFGHELVKLMEGLAGRVSALHFQEVIVSFITATLNSAPSTHKAFEKSLVAAIQAKTVEEKATREKAEGKQKGLGKFRGFAKAGNEEGEDDETGVQQVYTAEELQAIAAAEEEELKLEIEREKQLEQLRALAEKRRLENEKLLAEKKRVVDFDEAKAKLAAEGYEVAPAWDDKKKGKKGKR
jgi:hypothetical protein